MREMGVGASVIWAEHAVCTCRLRYLESAVRTHYSQLSSDTRTNNMFINHVSVENRVCPGLGRLVSRVKGWLKLCREIFKEILLGQ